MAQAEAGMTCHPPSATAAASLPGSRPALLQDVPGARLLRSGGEALSDAELLAVLVGGGRGGDRSLKLARGLLDEQGSLSALATATPAVLRHQGIPGAGAATLLAALELACRLAKEQIPDSVPLSRPAQVARYLVLRYQQRDQELMGALFLDVRHRLIGEKEIYRGTLHRAAVEPREILKECLLRGAAGFVLFHTHPSGDPTPSSEDLLFTRRMADAAAIVGVELVDHLVLGATGRWVSLRERGAW
jgi:DNA repair protein RadC